MAKIDTLEFHINGKTYTSNVNVGKTGTFKTELNWEVSETIGVKSPIIGKTKDSVVYPIIKAYHDYLDSEKQYNLYISIIYKSSKDFSKLKNGHRLFEWRSGFDVDGFTAIESKLHFGYKVYAKETNSLGHEIWHKTELIQEGTTVGEKDIVIDEYLVGSTEYSVSGKLIPFTKEAHNTLKKATEGIRGISEILFTFLNQEPELISSQLNKGNLLNQ